MKAHFNAVLETLMRGYSIRTEEVTRTFKLENICGLITLAGHWRVAEYL
jgi:hypothetical protein